MARMASCRCYQIISFPYGHCGFPSCRTYSRGAYFFSGTLYFNGSEWPRGRCGNGRVLCTNGRICCSFFSRKRLERPFVTGTGHSQNSVSEHCTASSDSYSHYVGFSGSRSPCHMRIRHDEQFPWCRNGFLRISRANHDFQHMTVPTNGSAATAPWLVVCYIILLQFIMPAAIALLTSEIMRKKGWIKFGDMKLVQE